MPYLLRRLSYDAVAAFPPRRLVACLGHLPLRAANACSGAKAVTLALLAAFIFASTPNAEAITYNPVFYYYHSEKLGSSNVLTNRAGERVQHYEYTSFGNAGYTDNS